MKLEFKPDCEAAEEQWKRFWAGTNTRPVVRAVLPKPGVTPVAMPSAYAAAQGDFGPVIDQLLSWGETHDFLGEAIPSFYLEFASDHFAALLGSELTFTKPASGGWAERCITDLASAEFRFDREGRWWKRTVEFAQAIRARCDGKLMIATTTLVSNLDVIASMYGPENLMMAMMDTPDVVHRALEKVDKAFGEVTAAMEELYGYKQFGSMNRHRMWHPGRCNTLQCDFSCMIGPDLFQEFVVPHLKHEVDCLNGNNYHLDGPDAIKHVEALCAIEGLGVIQWQCGAGWPEKHDWTELYDKIDRLGKGLLRGGFYDPITPSQAVALWKRYRCRNLYIFNLHVQSKMEFEDCLAALEAATADKEVT